MSDYQWYSVDYCGLELDIKAHVKPIIPAITSGDPDDCHQEEGGLEDITDIECDGEAITGALFDFLQDSEEIKEKLEAQA